MKGLSRLVLVFGFVLAMGCGEQSVGNTQQQPTDTAANQPASQQVAQSPGQGLGGAPLTYVEGTHYERLPVPVATADPARIEVTEVFWYGCSHCYVFESVFEPWKKAQADDVLVTKNPAIWDNRDFETTDARRYTTPMANHARIYYTAKVLNVLDTISPAAFLSLHNDPRGLRTREEIGDFFENHGVSRQDFDRTFMSFGVTNAVRQAEVRQGKYQVQGTPELVINGTYRVSGRMTGTQDAMLKVTDFLIEQIRRERN
jgi:protein dithiol oxidoreductase (disulfide-forming)